MPCSTHCISGCASEPARKSARSTEHKYILILAKRRIWLLSVLGSVRLGPCILAHPMMPYPGLFRQSRGSDYHDSVDSPQFLSTRLHRPNHDGGGKCCSLTCSFSGVSPSTSGPHVGRGQVGPPQVGIGQDGPWQVGVSQAIIGREQRAGRVRSSELPVGDIADRV